MREADALEELWGSEAVPDDWPICAGAPGRRIGPETPSVGNPTIGRSGRIPARMPASPSHRGDGRGRTDAAIARHLGMGGKDLYRQARAIWRLARSGDARAHSGVAQLDAGTKTIHAAYKDLRRRDRFGSDFRPTPYDVWPFRHDRAFGIPHPGSIPPALVAHALHYYTDPGALVVDPMAGGGTTLDVCQSMGRRCLAYDLHPVRPEIRTHDIRTGFPPEASGCDLIFCDPPYHTMLARQYACDSIATAPLTDWIAFLNDLARACLRRPPTGRLPGACSWPPRPRRTCPPASATSTTPSSATPRLARRLLPRAADQLPDGRPYLPQHVRRARHEGRLLGQVRDLLVMRKPSREQDSTPGPSRPHAGLSPFDLTQAGRIAVLKCSERLPFWRLPFWLPPYGSVRLGETHRRKHRQSVTRSLVRMNANPSQRSIKGSHRPARRPCCVRRGWRGSGCGGRAARGAGRSACSDELVELLGAELLDHRRSAACSAACWSTSRACCWRAAICRSWTSSSRRRFSSRLATWGSRS